jgi:L,D-peptidoglycan transpeptidase YkuD (ErfK/YbiS/YcfS/YnhG family)
MSDIHVISKEALTFKGKTYRCAIGPNGFTDTPKEGGKATPLGRFALRECWYRSDRLSAPRTHLALRTISPQDGWCDDPAHASYNRHVMLPFPASHEKLWLEDHTYDIVVPLGFNDAPVIAGIGSAIFFHLAKPDYAPTLGCVAVSLSDMIEILSAADASTYIVMGENA